MTDREIFMNAPAGATPEELEAFLDEMCRGDPELRRRVEALLAADEAAGTGFLEPPPPGAHRRTPGSGPGAVTADATLQDDFPVTEEPGDTIGNYRLLQRIGEGGFGVVYLAEQLRPVKRQVALKLIKLGMDTRQVVARFEAERQALAMMDHPNIAKIFDAGSTPRGRAFFVMELVKGVPVTRFCDERKMPTRDRLALFAEICSAVHHAHQKGIIHRDLKPSNVLVTQLGDTPVPKVIDFGIAKATQQKFTDKTLFTALDQLVGTPVYMSPEQAGANTLDIDTRSDIYSLGVLLYELLTGKPPFDLDTLRAAGLEEMRRLIREEDPPKPSTRIDTLGREERTTVAVTRGADPQRLNRLVRGDMDWIVMKAIEKDRTRRYESANALALDVNRYLRDEPVSAAAPSITYRFRKFARRHKGAFGAAAAIVAVALAGASIAFSLWSRQRDERADGLVQTLFDCRIERLPAVVAAVDSHASRVDGRLEAVIADAGRPASEHARARLALLARQPGQLAALHGWLLEASPNELGIVLGMLEGRENELGILAWSVLLDEQGGNATRLQAAAIGAFACPDDPRWEGLADRVAGALVDAGVYRAAQWLPLLRPVTERLAPALRTLYRVESDAPAGEIAAFVLAEANAADPAALIDLVRAAGPRQLSIVGAVLQRQADSAGAAIAAALSAPLTTADREDPSQSAAERSRLAMALLLLDRPAAFWPQLDYQAAPDLRTQLIHDLARYGIDWRVLDPGLGADRNPGIIAATLEALGGYDSAQLPGSVRAGSLRARVEALHAGHAHPGVHSSAEWLLRRWGWAGGLATADEDARTNEPGPDKNWYVTRHGDFTMAILPSGAEFLMGASAGELESEYEREYKRPDNESQHPERIARTLAVATKEVTYDQFMEFAREMAVPNKVLTPAGWKNPVSRTGDAAMSFVSLKEAMLYCRWFTKREGIPDQEQCYEFDGESFADDDPKTIEGYLHRSGYRILTEAEWEFASRGGTTTPRYFGSRRDLLPEYGWFNANTDDSVRPPGMLRPNPYGLFDTLGNICEWCQEPYRKDYQADPNGLALVVDERQKNPAAREGSWHAYRGGSFYHSAAELRAAWRHCMPYSGHPFTGFRIARTIKVRP